MQALAPHAVNKLGMNRSGRRLACWPESTEVHEHGRSQRLRSRGVNMQEVK